MFRTFIRHLSKPNILTKTPAQLINKLQKYKQSSNNNYACFELPAKTETTSRCRVKIQSTTAYDNNNIATPVYNCLQQHYNNNNTAIIPVYNCLQQ